MNPELSLIIPLRDERECLPQLFECLHRELPRCAADYEIILIDDGSGDGSWNLIRELAANDSRIKGLRFSRNFGKESAMRAGLRFCRGQAAIIMDADLQHPPELIPEMVKAWRNDRVPVVQAVKEEPSSDSFLNRFGGSAVYWVLNRITGFNFTGSCDFKLLDRQVIERVNSLPEKITFMRGVVSWLGYNSTEIRFRSPDRAAGKTNWSFFRLISLAIDALTGFSGAALRLVTIASFTFLLFASVLILQTLYNWLSGTAVEGFTTVIIVVLIVGSVLAFGLGVVGEYLARIFDEIKGRPDYIIAESINGILTDKGRD